MRLFFLSEEPKTKKLYEFLSFHFLDDIHDYISLEISFLFTLLGTIYVAYPPAKDGPKQLLFKVALFIPFK